MTVLSPQILRVIMVFGASVCCALSACSFDFDRFDRPCRQDSDCVDNGTCDALRGICAPTRYWRPLATVETWAGSGDQGSKDGARDKASFNGPTGVALLSADSSLIVADRSSHRLRRVTQAQVTRLAGLDSGFVDGALDDARFTLPTGLAAAKGEIYIADTGNHRVRLLQTDMITSLSGGAAGFVDGAIPEARFNQPQDVALLADGRVVVADRLNNRIRVIDGPGNTVKTLAGRAGAGFADGPAADAQFDAPSAVAVDSKGRILVADSGNNRIRAITLDATARVETLAGGEAGFADGAAAEARFSSPQGVMVVGDAIFIADTLNSRIRVIEAGEVSTLCGGGTSESVDGNASAARLERPIGITASPDGKAIYVADQQGNRIRRVNLP